MSSFLVGVSFSLKMFGTRLCVSARDRPFLVLLALTSSIRESESAKRTQIPEERRKGTKYYYYDERKREWPFDNLSGFGLEL